MSTLATGKVFVFTGKISVTREQASTAVRNAGGFTSSSVSRNVDYVVTGERTGSKEARAIVLGVPRITEGELLKLLEELPEDELYVEEWLKYGIKIITEETLLNLLQKLETRIEEEETQKTVYLPREEMSYENMFVLNQLLADHTEHLNAINLQPKICRHCNKIIPYSIHFNHYYCFNCHRYENTKVHVCQWGPCLDLPSTLDNWYEECVVCENVRPVSKSKLAERFDFELKSDFGHSAELAFNCAREVAANREREYEPLLNGSFINDERYKAFIQYLGKKGIMVNNN